MKIRIIFISLIIACVSLLKVTAQTPYLPHYTTKNGLPSNNCFFILNDKKGYIWVATDAGVSRFDGSVFENFTIDDGLPDNQILQIKEDRKGRIWFLALNGQLSYFYNGIIYNQQNDEKLKQLNFNAIIVSFLEDSKGKFWFGTNKNVIGVWDEKTLIKYASPDINKQYTDAFIHEDKQGNIWAYGSNAAYVFLKNNFVLFENHQRPLSFKTIINHIDGNMYFLNHTGLNVKTGTSHKNILKVDTNLLNNRPGYIYLAKNELWLSNNSGVFVLNFNGKTEQILKNVDVNQVIKDQNQNMWFTTKNGIYRLPALKERLYIYDHSHGLNYNSIKSITKDNQNRLWLGLNNGHINIFDLNTKKFKDLALPNPLKYNLIKQLTFNQKEQNIYFASDYGLGYLPVGNPTLQQIKYLKESQNSVFVVKSFSLDTGKQLAMALSSGVVIISDRKDKFEFSASTYTEKLDYFKDRSYNVFYDNQQNLWFSNLSGVSSFKNEKLTNHYLKNQLLTKRINDIKSLKNGNIVMATDGYGILILANGKLIHHITQKNGLNHNIINKLFIKNDEIWSISRNGINRIVIKDKIIVSTFDYANDLLIDDLNDLYIDEKTAFFGTNNGLVFFAHQQETSQTKAPKTYISSITINKQLFSLSNNTYQLKPGQHTIVINYSAIDFKNKRIMYRYRLNPNNPWSETRSRRVELSSIEPGNYQFEVSAKSEDSDWSTSAIISFNIEKHFWQTWFFSILLILMGGFILYNITVYFTKRQKNKEQEELLNKNKILMLEQQALQAMMNPHFVFNVMNSIQHYINTQNTASANKVLTGFAKLIRKNLEICTQSYIILEEEIDYLNLYLNLEKYRFGEKLNFKIEIDQHIDRDEIRIPSMILQPFLENAIWHGIMPKEEGGEVRLSIKQEDETYLKIQIIDDGVGINNSLLNKKTNHQSKGMQLTEERIKLLNYIALKPIQLNIKQNGDAGTIVTILIPLT